MSQRGAVPGRLDASKAVLVVIDVQNDFCAPGGAMDMRGRNVSCAASTAVTTAALMSEARRHGVPIVIVRTTHSDATHDDPWRYRCAREDPPEVCREGTWGAELFCITEGPSDRVVTKHRYSAFSAAEFETTLTDLGRRSLLFAGVATNVCVETTLRDAVCAGYYTSLIEDCCASYRPQSHDATVANVEDYFGLVTSSDRLIAHWKAGQREGGHIEVEALS